MAKLPARSTASEWYTAPKGAVFERFEIQRVVLRSERGVEYYVRAGPQREKGEVHGVYGEMPDGTVEHIADRRSVREARRLVRRLGGFKHQLRGCV